MSAPLPRRSDGRVLPADPTKPLNRTTRRVLFYLSRNGRLRKQICRDRKNHKRFTSDPEKYYWILEPMPEIVWRGNVVRERRVSRSIIEGMQAKGYLRNRLAEPDEITCVDLGASEEELRDLFARTDWNGNWVKPGLSAIVERARRESQAPPSKQARKARKEC